MAVKWGAGRGWGSQAIVPTQESTLHTYLKHRQSSETYALYTDQNEN